MDIQSTSAVAAQLSLALDLIGANTDVDWRADALLAVHSVCLAKKSFICDDVWLTGLRSAHNDKALGPIMVQAGKNQWCRKTDRVRPSRRSHLSGKPVWESLLMEDKGNETPH